MDKLDGEIIPKDEMNIFSKFMKTYSKGEILMTEGDTSDKNLFLVRKGTVGIYRMVNGQNELITQIEAVNFVGEMELILDGPRISTVKAYTDEVLVYQFINPNLESIAANKEWGGTLAKRLTTDLKFFSDKTIGLEREVLELKHGIKEEQLQTQTVSSEYEKLKHNVCLLLATMRVMNQSFASQVEVYTNSGVYVLAVNELIDRFTGKYFHSKDIKDETFASTAVKTLLTRDLIPESLKEQLPKE
jgi:CRP-like cAMP-binding protein